MELMGSAREIALNHHKSKLVFLSAESGMGKSTMVVHAIEHIRKMMGRRRLIITKHVSKESDLLVPFGMFRSILVDVMSHFHTSADDKSTVSYGTSEGLESVGWESLSGGSFSDGSFAASAATGMTRSADRLGKICRELNAPQAFQELVGHHLLGIDAQVGGSKPAVRKGNKPHSMISLVSFMAKAFIRCTQDASLVILALDDVHYMDEMSWRVVQELFTTGTGMLFICTSRPLTTYKLSVSRQFWDALEGVHTENGTFIAMKMESLGEDDIRDMIAKTLGMQESQISSTLHRDVLMHSGGMPHFANEILDTMKRRFASDGQCRRAAEDYNAETAFESVGELLLHRIDSFDVSVRNVLNLGAVLGNSFELIEIVAVLQRMSGEDPQLDILRMESTRAALEFAVEEGILYMQYDTEEKNDNAEIPFGESITSMASSNPHRSHRPDGHPSNKFVTYTFCHDIWRTMILNLMLDSRKRDMHRIIALTLEAQHGDDTDDYLSRMKLFSHWKASGESTKAAELALCIGKSFESLGLQDQSIKLYEDAIEMWHDKSTEGGGFTKQVLDSINVTDLECIINVYIASGKCLANMHKVAESVLAYQNALLVLQSAKSSEELKDRSIVFPIFSGLFLALKFGQIDQDEVCTYEQGLVERFVHETRLHGDPIHYARALAMQGEMYGRLGIYDKAFAAKKQMHFFYVPATMSECLCQDYGSDRCAQLYCVSILWHQARGQNAKALEMCWFVINELIPKMDEHNVHNSMMMMYPVIWTLKENDFVTEAREHFTRIVVAAFDKYYGDGRSTFFLPLYDPILMLLDLAEGDKVNPESHGEYIEWALDEKNLRFGIVLNRSTGNLGRCADTITAEICYLLALQLDDGEDKRALVLSGLDIAMEMVSLREKKRMIHASSGIETIYQRISSLALELGIEI
jgi:tetratricopeptide (TPR) repeat protein